MDVEIEKDILCGDFSVTKSYVEVPTVDVSSLNYDDFFRHFIITNHACVIVNACTKWESSNKWVVDAEPNFDYLNAKYGHCKVTVYDCNERYFNSQKTKETTVKDYIDYWKQNAETSAKYLKDWHLKNQFPDDPFYEVPLYFSSDWLNEYLCENSLDDYRFVYMGPKGTWTPFHADVFTSYSWSANVCGCKKWLLFPPGEEAHLKDSHGNLPYNLKEVAKERTCFEVTQHAGEAIFVPSGWHHQVWNLEDTISINHNWINGCNVKTMWLSLQKSLQDVKDEIKDCSDMDNFSDHCQIVLKALFGLNYQSFYDFISYIALKRMKLLKQNVPVILFGDRCLGKNHAIFDLIAIKNVLTSFVGDDDALELTQNDSALQPDLLEKINFVLEVFN